MSVDLTKLKQQAESGDINAQYSVGKQYLRSGDYSNCVYWLRKAARKNHPKAQFLLSRELEEQGYNEESMHWLCCAHLNGLVEATDLMNENIEFEEKSSVYAGQDLCRRYKEHIAFVERLGIDYDRILEEKNRIKKIAYIITGVTFAIVFLFIKAIF